MATPNPFEKYLDPAVDTGAENPFDQYAEPAAPAAITPDTPERADYSALLTPTVKTEESKAPGRITSAAAKYAHGFGSMLGAIPKAIGEGAIALANKHGDSPLLGNPEGITPEQTTAYKVGDAIEKWFKKFEANPEYKDDFWTSTIPEGAGTMTGFLLGGVAGKAAKLPSLAVPAGMGAASQGVGGVDDYIATMEEQGKEVDPQTRAEALGLNAALGTSEALPIIRILNRIDRISSGGVKKIAAEGFKGGIEELSQEVLQTLGGNYIASDIIGYDTERGLWSGAKESGQAGFTLGFMFNTLAAMLGAKRAGRRTKTDQPLDEPTPESGETLRAQLDAFTDGRKRAILLTPGEAIPDELPPGTTLETLDTGKGTLIYRQDDPQALELANAGKLGDVLGYGISDKPEGAETVVTARDADGRVVQMTL